MHGSSDCNPASISQWCDDQSACGTHIFTAVLDRGIDLSNENNFFLLIVPKLLLPVEIISALNILIDKSLNYIPGMHISCNKWDKNFPLDGM
jgi:hypothetical protein